MAAKGFKTSPEELISTRGSAVQGIKDGNHQKTASQGWTSALLTKPFACLKMCHVPPKKSWLLAWIAGLAVLLCICTADAIRRPPS